MVALVKQETASFIIYEPLISLTQTSDSTIIQSKFKQTLNLKINVFITRFNNNIQIIG